MTLDPKALDAASYAMQEVACCSSENICDVCRKDASVVIAAYLDHALPALLAAAERRGAEAMQKKAAKMASDASTTNTRIHPDIPFNEMSKQAQTTMHMMAQFITEEILCLALPTEPTPAGGAMSADPAQPAGRWVCGLCGATEGRNCPEAWTFDRNGSPVPRHSPAPCKSARIWEPSA